MIHNPLLLNLQELVKTLKKKLNFKLNLTVQGVLFLSKFESFCWEIFPWHTLFTCTDYLKGAQVFHHAPDQAS